MTFLFCRVHVLKIGTENPFSICLFDFGLKISASSNDDMENWKKIDYRGKMILAPMVKIGTLPTRLLAIDYGADLVYTEEIIDWRLLRCKRVVNSLLETVDYIDKTDDTLVLRISGKERGKLVLQIGTSDPDRAVRVAKMVENDVDAIDVNMGCPKSFSLKGGMGAALLNHPDKIYKILTSLVAAVSIPVTCKIRIKSDLEKTLELVKVIESTGVTAFAVHGRTKDERPNHANHVDVIQEVVKAATKVPVIANGGSANSRDSPINTHEGIKAFWKETGAASVMIARAAEWNVSVFNPKGLDNIYNVIDKYLDYAIHFDQPHIVCKYNIQQILGGDQDKTAKGKAFLAAATMQEMCKVFGKEDQFLKRQEWLRTETERLCLVSDTKHVRREQKVLPRKRKFSDMLKEDEDHLKGLEVGEDRPAEVTEMYCPFIRGHYVNPTDIPKAYLVTWLRKKYGNDHEGPKYATWQKDKMFRSIVTVNGESFSSESWEKNKRYSEQAAAIVALHCLGVKEIELENGASTGSGLVYKKALTEKV